MASPEAIQQFRYCWICEAEFANSWPREVDWIVVDCRVCGKYRISETLYATAFPLPDSERYRVSFRLKRATLEGRKPPDLTAHTFPALSAGLPTPRTHEKTGLLIVSLALAHPAPGEYFPFDEVREYSLAGAKNSDEVRFFIDALKSNGCLKSTPSGFLITPHGWSEAARLAEVEPTASKRCFAAFHFVDEMHAVFRDGIAPAITDAGFEPRIANAPAHNEQIDARIVAEIRQARFVVADVTYARTGVYFEAGYALGLGRQVIWTCRADREKEDMHFDTRQYNHILWSDAANLRDQLYTRIVATI